MMNTYLFVGAMFLVLVVKCIVVYKINSKD